MRKFLVSSSALAVSCFGLLGCSTQESVAPQEMQFFTPLTRIERRTVESKPRVNPCEADLAVRDAAIDSLRKQLLGMRDAAAKLEKMIVAQNQVVLEKGKSVILQGVNFEASSAVLTRQSEAILRRALVALVANPDVKVEIAGYTDDRGNPQVNENLSLQRAQSVRDWLVESGIEAQRMTVVGFGMRDPIEPNTTPAGRARNGRIEFHVSN